MEMRMCLFMCAFVHFVSSNSISSFTFDMSRFFFISFSFSAKVVPMHTSSTVYMQPADLIVSPLPPLYLPLSHFLFFFLLFHQTLLVLYFTFRAVRNILKNEQFIRNRKMRAKANSGSQKKKNLLRI